MTNLQARQYLRLTEAAGTTVTAHLGAVWITEQESRRDIVLRAGQTFTFTRSGVVLLEAFSPAAVSFDS